MVSTIVFGGLGNQLFIYATARALALRLDTEVSINTSMGFKDDDLFHRNFELGGFNIRYVKDRASTFAFIGGKSVRKISRIIGRNVISPSYIFLKDRTGNRGVDKRLFELTSKNVFLEGYWQSPNYFNDYADIIREDLKITMPISPNAIKLENEMFASRDCTPVCVGVRRYQECTSPNMLGALSVIGEEYYLDAINIIKEYVDNPVFYVFTQDRDWVNECLKKRINADIRVVDNHNNSAIDDLYLMTKFEYHIISNSSFYWWGAWLASGKIVVSTRLFLNEKSNLDSWIVI